MPSKGWWWNYLFIPKLQRQNHCLSMAGIFSCKVDFFNRNENVEDRQGKVISVTITSLALTQPYICLRNSLWYQLRIVDIESLSWLLMLWSYSIRTSVATVLTHTLIRPQEFPFVSGLYKNVIAAVCTTTLYTLNKSKKMDNVMNLDKF